jgi:hypothetical protein
MKQERIQINGEWYVKETIATPPKAIELSDLTFTAECIYETDDYLWIASKLARTHHTLELVGTDYYEGIDIKFTDKNTGIEEYWDNDKWILGVYHNDKESIKIAKESMSIEGIEIFRQYIKSLIMIGWLKDNYTE